MIYFVDIFAGIMSTWLYFDLFWLCYEFNTHLRTHEEYLDDSLKFFNTFTLSSKDITFFFLDNLSLHLRSNKLSIFSPYNSVLFCFLECLENINIIQHNFGKESL